MTPESNLGQSCAGTPVSKVALARCASSAVATLEASRVPDSCESYRRLGGADVESTFGIELDIPGFKQVNIRHLVLGFNGTLALDGVLLPGVAERLALLSSHVHIHVVTADTFGTAEAQVAGLPVSLHHVGQEAQAKAKRMAVLRFGSETVLAVGNGRNDQQMISSAAIGIAVIHREGAAGLSLTAADVVVTDVLHALDLLLFPQRLVATLRS